MTRFALILGLLLSLTVPAAGQKGDLQRQIAEKQRAIDALEKQIARGEQELTSIKKGKNSEQQSVRRLSRQIASRRQLLDETESQLSLLAEQLAASDSTAGALNVRLERYRAQYAAMVREAYRNYKQNSYLTYIFASKDFADVARRIANIRGVAKLREAKLREIAETAQEVGRQQELLAAQQQALETRMNAQYQDMLDYYTLWAHQIKTPIASMRLCLQQEDTPQARRLLQELSRAEQYVEMVMVYLRLNGGSDLVLRECQLDGIVRRAVRRFAGEFIGRKLKLCYEPLNVSCVTDEKWLLFVIEQVLSNSLKYTRAGSITIELEAPKTLVIRDTGIGVAPEDLPRIFEKGYTGYNGRGDQKASGLGLYLCRTICKRLGHTITASSVPDHGTAIRITLEQRQVRE